MTNNVDNADKNELCKDYKVENDIPYCMRLGCRIECEGKSPCSINADKNVKDGEE